MVVDRSRTLPLTQAEALPTPSPGAAGEYAVGDRIGAFRLARQIGAGGMGVVFLAEQAEPLQRLVALKLVAPNFADAFASALFMVERQSLARLEHPHIARLYEAGSTDDGALYFAMEWISGEPIDQHCRARKLDRAAILRLMVAVCRGVQHAHTRGVIHRDLKPANILVANIDGVATPKIIDFGIAGAPGHAGGASVGTLGYMAPEQAQPGELIDQRADVYALGVVLLELLTESAGIDHLSWWALDASAREQMLLTNAGAAPLQRQLVAQMPRDLRAILAQALRPDREQRYSGAEALAEDLLRYLGGFPVHARPRTRRYVLARFIGRHRYAVTSGALAVLAIVALMVNTTLAWRATEREALKAAQTAQFLQSVLAGVDPLQAQELDRTLLRQVLDKAAARVDHELAEQPAVRAEVTRTIADTYRALGEAQLALKLIEPVHADIRQREGASALPTLAVERSLLQAIRAAGEVARARTLAEDLYPKERIAYGADAGETQETAAILLALMHEAGQLQQARAFGEARLIEQTAATHPDARARLLNELAQAHSRIGNHARALQLMQQAVELREQTHGIDDLQAISARTEIGVLHFQAKRYAEALALWRELVPRYMRSYGPDHPDTLAIRGNIASALTMTGAPAESAAIFTDLVAIRRRLHGSEHPETLIAVGNLAAAQFRAGNFAAAETAFREYVGLCDRIYQPQHPSCAERRNGLGKSLRELGRYAEAEPFLLEAHRLKGQVEGSQFAGPQIVADELAELYRRWGREDLAAQWAERGSAKAQAVRE